MNPINPPILKQDGKKEPKNSASHAKDTNHEKGDRKEIVSNKLMLVFTGIIALCTFLYFGVSYFQWRALLDSNKINRESIQSIQRAFVKFDSFLTYNVNRHTQEKVKHNIYVMANWENSGTTPAVDIRARFVIDHLPKIPNNNEFQANDIKAPIQTGQYIGPKGNFKEAIEKPFSFFAGQEYSDISSAPGYNPNVFFWGWIVYRDVFPQTKPHLTEFCFRLTNMGFTGDKSKTPRDIVITYDSCKEHNCVDEHCPDYDDIIKFVGMVQN